ncbi:hypothetical protein ACHAXN_002542 [Cyclotella atomus]
MTSAALSFGSALLAFSPSISLLLFLVIPKAQLLILAICSAFAYLLSSLFSSAFWWLFRLIPGSNNEGWSSLLTIVLPSVLSQYFVRCYFVKMYFRVEKVIQKSVAKHEAENNSNTSDDSEGHEETNALQLQLNDLSCSLASGAGYAFLHSLFLFGTLLASESGEQYSNNGTERDGTLYQPSCSLPSLIHGALIAGLFSILDVVWMMCTFYGMRRRAAVYSNGGNSAGMIGGTIKEGLSFITGGLPDNSKGGNGALGLVMVTHLAASLALAPNMKEEGCKVSLSCLGLIVVLTGVCFARGVKGHYLPVDQRRRIEEMGSGDVVGSEHHVD